MRISGRVLPTEGFTMVILDNVIGNANKAGAVEAVHWRNNFCIQSNPHDYRFECGSRFVDPADDVIS